MNELRKTKSVCPTCIKKIDAKIIEENGKVYMLKECSEHGNFKILISTDASYYKELDYFYFSLNDEPISNKKKQKEFTLYLNLKCNLNCPICLANANIDEYTEPSLDFIKSALKRYKNVQITLFGGEPTLREDLPEIIKIVKDSGNHPTLFTNGVKIADYAYLKELFDNGLKEVYLSFDGFDDEAYKKIRNQALAKIKFKALNNLKKLDISTTLAAVIGRDINEKEIKKILDFAIQHHFIKRISFQPYVPLGISGLDSNKMLLKEELIDIIERETEGKISKEKVLNFQKLAYVFDSFLSSRNMCVNSNFILMYRRTKGKYLLVNDILGLKNIQKILGKYLEFRNNYRIIAKIYLFLRLSPKLINLKILPLLRDSLSVLINKKMRGLAKTSNLSKHILFISFGSTCNPHLLDFSVIRNCMIGEIPSLNEKISSWCMGNILRERRNKSVGCCR